MQRELGPLAFGWVVLFLVHAHEVIHTMRLAEVPHPHKWSRRNGSMPPLVTWPLTATFLWSVHSYIIYMYLFIQTQLWYRTAWCGRSQITAVCTHSVFAHYFLFLNFICLFCVGGSLMINVINKVIVEYATRLCEILTLELTCSVGDSRVQIWCPIKVSEE